MGKFINKYARILYQNINKKIYIIAIIFFGILIIWTLISKLFGIETNNEEEPKNTSSYKPAETVISGKDITESVYADEEALINTFVDYCNNGNTEEAYNMLSQDCKDIFFKTKEDFIQNYYNEIFSTKRECNIQSWITEKNYNTYRVRLIDDIMSTGDYSNSKNYQDYITVVKDGDNQYLNVKGLMHKKELKEVEKEVEELKVSAVSLTTYVDYEEYTFSVKNKTDKAILMDSLKNASDTMYLELSEDKKRTCDTSGLSEIGLTIEAYTTKEISIKYNKSAGASTDEDKKIHFLNIIKDYDAYMEDKDNYEDILKLTISL